MSFRETMDLIAIFLIPVLLVAIPVYALVKRVPVY
jgi:hypothetical protein